MALPLGRSGALCGGVGRRVSSPRHRIRGAEAARSVRQELRGPPTHGLALGSPTSEDQLISWHGHQGSSWASTRNALSANNDWPDIEQAVTTAEIDELLITSGSECVSARSRHACGEPQEVAEARRWERRRGPQEPRRFLLGTDVHPAVHRARWNWYTAGQPWRSPRRRWARRGLSIGGRDYWAACSMYRKAPRLAAAMHDQPPAAAPLRRRARAYRREPAGSGLGPAKRRRRGRCRFVCYV